MKAREGDDRGWDGWMTSPTWWTRLWAGSRTCYGQRSLGYCSPCSCKESDTTEWLNWTEVCNCNQTEVKTCSSVIPTPTLQHTSTRDIVHDSIAHRHMCLSRSRADIHRTVNFAHLLIQIISAKVILWAFV